jgi:hypothetical protein
MSEEIEKLIVQFKEASLKHFQATQSGDYKVANKNADRIHKTFLKMRELGTEAREALLQVATQDDGASAAMAATYSLKYAPERSLAVLRRLSSDRGILGFNASQAIKRWQSGEWLLE